MVSKIAKELEPTKEGNSSSSASADEGKMETGGDGPTPPTFTPEQLARKVKCKTHEGEIIEVPWHLMMQSKTFMNMWGNLDAETTFDEKTFIFPLNDINAVCFAKIVEWLEQHNGMPDPQIEEEPITGERKWFTFTEWEKNFFQIDFEQLKEYYLAANFLEVRSLYLYCAQECARHIMDKPPEVIREMLCLPDDLTEEEKDASRTEFQIADQQPDPANNANGQPAANDQQPAANADDGQQAPQVVAVNGNDVGQPPAVVNGNDADGGQPEAAVNGKDAAK